MLKHRRKVAYRYSTGYVIELHDNFAIEVPKKGQGKRSLNRPECMKAMICVDEAKNK